MSDTPAVDIKNLVKEFKTSFRRHPIRAVDKVSLTIEAGEVYGLIGPNGSGKSTTMKALLGLVAPTSGTCAIYGRDSTKVDSRQEVGFLPENPYFYKHLTGAEMGEHIFNIYSLTGLIFVISCYTFPYIFVLVANALDRIPGDLEDASSMLGGGTWTTARRITIPLALPITRVWG